MLEIEKLRNINRLLEDGRLDAFLNEPDENKFNTGKIFPMFKEPYKGRMSEWFFENLSFIYLAKEKRCIEIVRQHQEFRKKHDKNYDVESAKLKKWNTFEIVSESEFLKSANSNGETNDIDEDKDSSVVDKTNINNASKMQKSKLKERYIDKLVEELNKDKDEILKAIKMLPKEQRQCMEYRCGYIDGFFVEEKTIKEIADEKYISEPTVRDRIKQAKRNIVKIIDSRYTLTFESNKSKNSKSAKYKNNKDGVFGNFLISNDVSKEDFLFTLRYIIENESTLRIKHVILFALNTPLKKMAKELGEDYTKVYSKIVEEQTYVLDIIKSGLINTYRKMDFIKKYRSLYEAIKSNDELIVYLSKNNSEELKAMQALFEHDGDLLDIKEELDKKSINEVLNILMIASNILIECNNAAELNTWGLYEDDYKKIEDVSKLITM